MTSPRRKVLFLIPFLSVGGAERVLLTLLRHLDRNRFELHLGVLGLQGELLAELPPDVVIHNLKVPRVRYAIPAVVRLIRQVRPQTVLSTLAHLNFALILSRPFLPRGTKLLVREAAPASILAQETRYPHTCAWLYRRLYRKVDRVICLCDAMLNEMAREFSVPRERLVRIYNPVDIDLVRELALAGGDPYSGARPRLVACGRLAREKGFDLLIDAMPTVVKQVPGAHLTIVGDGALRTDLQAQITKLGLKGIVEFVGTQRNPWRYFKYADLLVLPSRYEGMSNVLLEALALGLPVVATDCPGGNREIACIDPRVQLVPTGDIGELSRAIVSNCMRHGSDRQQLSGSRDLVQYFGILAILNEYTSVLSA